MIYIGKIEGGDWTSSVPAWCRFEVRVGTYPGWERDWVRREVERALLDAAAADPFLAQFPPTVRPKGQYGDGYVLEGGADAIAALRRSHREVFARDLLAITSSGSSDARILGHRRPHADRPVRRRSAATTTATTRRSISSRCAR